MFQIAIVILTSFLLSGCNYRLSNLSLTQHEQAPTQVEQPASSPSASPLITHDASAISSVFFIIKPDQAGHSAEQILASSNYQVEYQDFGEAGKFITAIDNQKSDNEHYWAFYLNDEYSQTGVSTTIVEAGDKIEFKYEKIEL